VVAEERPNFVVAFLVRAALIRVPAGHRAWLARELLAGAARRRTAVAAGFPLGVTISATWALLNTLDADAPTSAWVGVAAFAPYLVLSMFGLGYRRQAQYLRKKNGLVAEPGDGGAAGPAAPKRA
jgi:hypothetical protein